MSQHSIRALGARCPCGTGQTEGRSEQPLEGPAVAVLTALGNRDAAVRDTKAPGGAADDDHRGAGAARPGRVVRRWRLWGA
jgi:hypothetical protein